MLTPIVVVSSWRGSVVGVSMLDGAPVSPVWFMTLTNSDGKAMMLKKRKILKHAQRHHKPSLPAPCLSHFFFELYGCKNRNLVKGFYRSVGSTTCCKMLRLTLWFSEYQGSHTPMSSLGARLMDACKLCSNTIWVWKHCINREYLIQRIATSSAEPGISVDQHTKNPMMCTLVLLISEN